MGLDYLDYVLSVVISIYFSIVKKKKNSNCSSLKNSNKCAAPLLLIFTTNLSSATLIHLLQNSPIRILYSLDMTFWLDVILIRSTKLVRFMTIWPVIYYRDRFLFTSSLNDFNLYKCAFSLLYNFIGNFDIFLWSHRVILSVSDDIENYR